jgi:hypothetical protein
MINKELELSEDQRKLQSTSNRNLNYKSGSAPFFRWLLSFGFTNDLTKKPAPPVAAHSTQQSDAPELLQLQTVAPDDSSARVLHLHECSALNRP